MMSSGWTASVEIKPADSPAANSMEDGERPLRLVMD